MKAGPGRPKGLPNKVTKALKEMILGALDDAGGQRYLAVCAASEPKAFLALLGRVLPLSITGDGGPLVVNVVRFSEAK